MSHHELVIVGAGTAGLTVASQLLNQAPNLDIAVIEPSDKHYYQPIWTLVGAGVFDRYSSERPQASVMPPECTWIKERVVSFNPEKNEVVTDGKEPVSYDYLVVAAGIKLDWDRVKGLRDALGKNGVSSNYSFDTVEKTWDFIQATKSGNALFTFPSTPIKCAGAPQKIMYLAEEHWRKVGVRPQVDVTYMCAGAAIFGVPKYRKALEKIVEERDIRCEFKQDLVEIRADAKEAVFRHLESGEETVKSYEMIHVTPHQCAPDFISESALAGEGGWVEVDKHTTQHTRFSNVFSLGDCSSLPTSKTGAAIRKQAPVLVENLLAVRNDEPVIAHYDGYASCPLVTGRGKVILAEFGYDGKIMESFPFDQSEERYSMYALKAYGLPKMYWHGMLKGRV